MACGSTAMTGQCRSAGTPGIARQVRETPGCRAEVHHRQGAMANASFTEPTASSARAAPRSAERRGNVPTAP
jgi:hypothetical protein